MKTAKKLLSMLLAVMMIVSIVPITSIEAEAATFNDINQSSVFVKQQASNTCTLASAVMLVRRAAMLSGNTNWASITESSMKGTAWAPGLRHSFTYAGISVAHASLPTGTANTSTLINLLNEHPEGIVLYYRGGPHAILLTDYTDGVFYCADPANNVASGRIPISQAYKVTISNATEYWYVSSPKLTISESPANIGDGFFGVILNTAYWKPIHLNSDTSVTLETEAGIANQLWYFDRQDDGSYVISSTLNGNALEMQDGNLNSGTQVVCKEYWGGYYQAWWIYQQGNGYVFVSKHYPEYNLAITLSGNNSADGTKITTTARNNTSSQIWSVYSREDVQLKAATIHVNVGDSATETTFTWNNTYGESAYDLKIWKNEIWLGEPYHVVYNATSECGVRLPAGTYQAYVDTLNHYQCLMSNVVTFTVPEKICNINYNANGGSGTMPSSTVSFMSDFSLSPNTFTKTGYTFIGWNAYRHSDSKWFVEDKGWQTETAIKSNTYVKKIYSSSVTMNFNESWFTQLENITDTDTFTFYAVWKPNTYTVKFNANGGTGTMSNQTYTYGYLQSLSANRFTKQGYSFVGWSTSPTATSAEFSDMMFVQNLTSTNGGTVTLYAVWKANTYTVSYNANGGTGAPSSQTKTYGKTLTLSSTKPTRTGYTFLGWSTSSTATSATYSAGNSFTTNANTTLYAVWKANTYTVSYNANGGTGAPSCQTKTYGKTLTLSSTIPTRTGYTFLGWSTSSTATSATYSAGDSFTSNANTTFYAVWAKDGYDINSDGIVDSNDTGLYKHDGTWYYIVNGDINYDYTGLIKHTNGIWYYVEDGVLDWSHSGLWKHNGVWYYVQKGQINWKFTGLVKHTNGIWYYVKGAKINWGYTGLVKHNTGSWFYVQKGQINFSKTGLVKHINGKYYYVQKGKLNWKYTGYAYYNGKKYKVVNGVKV